MLTSFLLLCRGEPLYNNDLLLFCLLSASLSNQHGRLHRRSSITYHSYGVLFAWLTLNYKHFTPYGVEIVVYYWVSLPYHAVFPTGKVLGVRKNHTVLSLNLTPSLPIAKRRGAESYANDKDR